MYWIATLGPIEVGRVTLLAGEYFVTVNAVSSTIPPCVTPQLPLSTFIKTFTDLTEAQIYAISFFHPNTNIQWEMHE